jgi:small-conductance mechanosensitive channel
LLVLSITIGASRLARNLVGRTYRRDPDHASGTTGLLCTMVSIAVFAVGLLVMLGTLGIKIVPLLGALGVGGLAAGLALQPTLTNLFAGFQIATSKQFRIGQRVRLASGEDGHIVDIAWRTTTLRTAQNYLVVIPNSKFADAIVTNYNLPEPPVNITLPITVQYDSDPRRVEAALMDEGKRLVAEVPELVASVAPVVRLHSFGESGLAYQVVLRAQDIEAQPVAQSTAYVRLLERLRREQIALAYPTRMLHLAAGGPAPERDIREAVARTSGPVRRGATPASAVGSAGDTAES